jgi:GT2 family glycosyltransferase
LEVLEEMLNAAENNPDLWILSCSQVTDSGKDTRPYGFSLGLRTLTSFLRSIYKLIHKPFPTKTLESGSSVLFPDWVSGSVVMMSRDQYKALDGWCEDFWMYYEDADLCKRTWEAGGKVALIQNLKVTHNHGGASRINLDVKALTKSEVIISRHVYIQNHSQGVKRFLMQSYLVLNNLFFSQLLIALVGIIFYVKPSFRVYPRLYFKLIKYYISSLANKTWISHRSINYKNQRAHHFEDATVEAPQLK